MESQNKIVQHKYSEVDEEGIKCQIYKNNAWYFDLADEIVKLAKETFPLTKPVDSGLPVNVQNAILALFTQAFRLYRGLITLCATGLDSEAMILLRSLLEVSAYLVFIAKEDSAGRLDWYLYSRVLSKQIAAEEYNRYHPESHIDMKAYEEQTVAAIEYFKNKHGHEKTLQEIKTKYTLRPDQAMQALKDKTLERHYKLIHRYASQIGHGDDLLEFISLSEDQSMFLLKIEPSDKWNLLCLGVANGLMYFNIETINSVLKLNNDAAVQDMFEKIKKDRDEQTDNNI